MLYLPSSLQISGVSTFSRAPISPPFPSAYIHIPRYSAHSNPSRNVNREFEKCLREEITYETSMAADLPTIEGFKTSLKGLEATFTRESKGELISISVHANEKIEPEIYSDPEMGGEGEQKVDDEIDDTGNSGDEEFAYLPLIYIDVTKPNGSKLKVECSFNPEADSLQTILETGLQINLVKVIPADAKDPDECFGLEGTHIDDKIYDHMVEYLESKGMGVDFLNQLIQFYQVFEHKLYLKEFLIKLNNFIKT